MTALMEDTTMGEAPAIQDATMALDPMDDDLFGEATDGLEIGVSLPSAPLPAVLVLRAAEMQRTGCCTKLAWSNTGSIAQIGDDGGKITFRTVQRDQKSGVWKLSEASKYPIDAAHGRHFVHVQWNGMGSELVAIDDLGRVQVFSMSGAVGRMQPAQGTAFTTDEQHGEIDDVVGVHWLPLYPPELRSMYITHAAKIEGKWMARTKNGDHHGNRIHHPAELKGALLYVTCTGKLSLLFQNDGTAWQSLSTSLDVPDDDRDLLSHAAFGENGDHLLLCTHDKARNLWLYKISINWNVSQQNRPNGSVSVVNPVFEIGHVVTLEYVAAQHSDMARLSHLRIVSPPPDVADQGSLSPTVLGVFTHATLPVNGSQEQSDAFSVIARWNVEAMAATLHESFARLKPNGTSAIQMQSTRLTRQPDSISTKLIITVDVQYFNTMIAFGASDGTIDFRDRAAFSTIETYGDTAMVSSLPHSGLEHMPGEQSLHVASSTDGSMLAFIQTDGVLRIKAMSPRYGWQPLEDGISDTKGLIETAIVSLARQYAISVVSSAANDETLAVLPADLSPELSVMFVKETLRLMSRNPDISMLDQSRQQQVVLKEPLLPRILSAQLALGSKHGSTHRTFAGQFAYVLVNLRLISLALAQTVSRGQEGKPDLLTPLVGLVKWSTDLMIYIVESLVSVRRNAQPGVSAKQAFEHAIAQSDTPALHLLLCSYPRTLLRFHTSYVSVYIKWVQLGRQKARTVQERQQLVDVYEAVRSMPFTLTAFQDLITEVDQAVRNAYTEASTTPERRNELELAMITEGHVPDELQPALQTLFETSLPKISEAADGGKLYFWDTEWLGISRSVPAAGATRYDALRKRPLTADMKLRMCRRCGAEMEDITPDQQRQLPPWLKHAERFCYCLNYWWAAS